MSEIYCPSCAQTFERAVDDRCDETIAPGSFEWTCPSRGIEFEIRIEYYPKEQGK